MSIRQLSELAESDLRGSRHTRARSLDQIRMRVVNDSARNKLSARVRPHLHRQQLEPHWSRCFAIFLLYDAQPQGRSAFDQNSRFDAAF